MKPAPSRPRATVTSTRGRSGSNSASRSVKIVVTGPFGAGKTSLIKTVSEIDVLSTERAVSDHTGSVKDQTTVAMDFGRITIDGDLTLYLFGTPGQKRFDFMWEILAEGMLGFIVLVDASRPASILEAQEILTFFRDVATVPYVVGLNKVAGADAAVVEEVRARLGVSADTRVVPFDALQKESVKTLMLEFLYAVLADIEDGRPATV